MRPLLEIAVQDAAGAATAVANGADRLELCVALAATGGLTPSIGLVENVCESARQAAMQVRQQTGAIRPVPRVAVLVRPREGGFVYSDAELAVMERDIGEVCAVRGVEAVVVGALTEAGYVDQPAMTRMLAAARGKDVVFHRAIDTLSAPETAVPAIVSLGCTRILTSGGKARAADGSATLKAMVDQAGGAVEIMAGGGVELDAIAALIDVGVDAIHLSARATEPSTPVGPGGGTADKPTTDGNLVRACATRIRECREGTLRI